MKSVLLACLLALTLSGCGLGYLVSEDAAVRALKDQGFTNITITGKSVLTASMWGCSDSDDVRFTATATNPAGKHVEVYVCSGFLKGSTVRSK
jgi:hypothetical protein